MTDESTTSSMTTTATEATSMIEQVVPNDTATTATSNSTNNNNNHIPTSDESHHPSNNISDSERTPPLSNRRKKRRGPDNYGAIDSQNIDTDEPSSSSFLLPDKNTNGNHTKRGGVSTSGSNTVGSRWPRGTPTSTSTGLSTSLLSRERSERSMREHRLNQWLECTIVILVSMIIAVSSGIYWYYNIHQKHVMKRMYQQAVATHAQAAAERYQQCYHIDWQTACDNLTNKAGARRQRQRQLIIQEPSRHSSTTTATKRSRQHIYGKKKGMSHSGRKHHGNRGHTAAKSSHYFVPNASIPVSVQEDELLQSDDPAVTYDNNCLKVYRLDINHGQLTFPYHSSQLLRLGGNQSMVLIIQHGALRNSEAYFCSFKQMMLRQPYRDFNDILIIAPDFNYATDDLVHPNDAVWNSSKPWGDWRVGAESDPHGIADMTIVEDTEGMTTTTTAATTTTKRNRLFDHSELRPTISSFDVLDHILAILTDRRLYPNVDKISFVGHSAGGQMVQRYAILSVLAALWFMDTGVGSIDIEFIIANPSSYTYLDPRRYTYNCGICTCSINNCTCDQDCTEPDDSSLQIPHRFDINHHKSDLSKFPCFQWNYDRWPYGIGSFTDEGDDGTLLHTVPYALRDGFVGVERATRMYRKLNMVYMVGQNDTCNDGLPTCSADCWKRTNYSEGEWPCFRNDMDTRCPAMLQGPYRRKRGYQYMKYLENLYGEPVHRLHTIPGVGHDASAMFSSEIALKELFD